MTWMNTKKIGMGLMVLPISIIKVNILGLSGGDRLKNTLVGKKDNPMIQGDTKEAACFNSPEESDYRTPPHNWRPLKHKKLLIALVAKQMQVIVECCDVCGAMRKIKDTTTNDIHGMA
jgi:hypothetical protein